MKTYTVTIIWDPEADVWVATSDDISGLVLESGLSRRLNMLCPNYSNLMVMKKSQRFLCP